jgi:hypothetical protein
MVDKDIRVQKSWKRMTVLERECLRQRLLTRLVQFAVMEPDEMEGVQFVTLISLTEVGSLLGMSDLVKCEMERLRATGIEGNIDLVTDLIEEFEARR